ncbi:GNAT family N-acetyltransferase [Sphingobacterium griseoflavum]|uniref:Phosphinothricin acetyltransferase n=1 Tax=Sphingobacterium griseoflavum TaxID=1474952 RepID=A0ABQ3HVL6_9SPHI|nr:GNAT family N-acetyltransferase [Sphingobacterium griseoflavum]GHE30881.1 phosphinothricin acetyltransferase [Sphingobacterium griseoflavum]
MEPLLYRDASASDLAQIVAIYNTTIASRLVTADTEEITAESRLAWFAEHSANRRPLWMVENQNGDTIGWVSFQSFYGRPAYNATVEVSIYLAADKRGAGYGKQILQHTLTVAPQFQIKTMLAFIFSHNIPSLNLFYRFGFTDWGNFPRIAEMDGHEYGLKILGKRLVP